MSAGVSMDGCYCQQFGYCRLRYKTLAPAKTTGTPTPIVGAGALLCPHPTVVGHTAEVAAAVMRVVAASGGDSFAETAS
jgi:hypothetical protein